METQEQVTKKVFEQVITEHLARFQKDLNKIIQDIDFSGCGAGASFGCCVDHGCCSEKDNEVISDLVGDRIDLLQDYIMSNKGPIVRFFKTRGIDLDL